MMSSSFVSRIHDVRPESVGPDPEDVTIHDGRSNDDINDLAHSLRERGFAFVRGVPTTIPLADFGKHFVHKRLKALVQVFGFRSGKTEPIMEPQINGLPPPPELAESAARVAQYYREMLPAVQQALPNLEVAIGFNQVARSSRAPPINMKTFNAFDGNIDPPAGNSIHTDNSPKQGFEALKATYNNYANKLKPYLQGNRYEVYWLNLWRNVDMENPVRNHHLAILDRSSLKHSDVNFAKLHFDGNDFEQMLLSRHEPYHRWTYFSDMKMDEILIFPQAKGIMERDGPGSEWRFSQPKSDHPEGTLHMCVSDPRHPDGERRSQENRFFAFVRLDSDGDGAVRAGVVATSKL